MPTHKIIKINGITIILCYRPNYNSVYFDLAIKSGSLYEDKDNNGISHLTEHLLSKKMIDKLKKHPWIKHYFNDTLNAYTSSYRTSYEFISHKNDLEQAFSMINEINSLRISKNDLEREKEIVLEELREYENDPYFLADDKFRKIYFDKHPLGFDELGTRKSLKKIDLNQIKNFIKNYYCQENIILTVSGDIKENKIAKLAKKLSFPNSSLTSAPPKFKTSGDLIYLINNPSFSQIKFHFCLTIPCANYIENFKYEFLIEILSNYLFYNLKEKLSLYSIKVYSETYPGIINFNVKSLFENKKPKEFLKALKNELNKFKNRLTEKDFEDFKNEKIKSIDLDKDYLREEANLIAWNSLVFGDNQILDLTDLQKIISQITLKEIYRLFDELFNNKKGTLMFLGKLDASIQKELKNLWKE